MREQVAAAPSARRRGKVVVIDDSRTILKSTQLVLESAGFEVITVQEPLMTSRVIFTERPDLVLVDVEMPALHGQALIRCIRNSQAVPDVVLLLHSTKSAKELRFLANDCGADGFITKTTDSISFIDQVLRWMPR